MNTILIFDAKGNDIPLLVSETDTGILLECHEPESFLTYVMKVKCPQSFKSDCYLKGFIKMGEKASFQMFDQFGVMIDKPLFLNEDESKQLTAELRR